MAVYTAVSDRALADFLTRFDVGTLVSAKGIAEGVENSNYLVDTTGGRFILTLYERRVDAADLPYFIALLDHVAAKGLPVPPAIADRDGRTIHEVAGRPACLIRFLPGVSLSQPNPAQARQTGAALRALHDAAADFPHVRNNSMGVASWRPLLDRCGADLDRIDRGLRRSLTQALDEVEGYWPQVGERTTIHADLFPDNVLMLGDRVTGLIDFYFACTDLRLYDVAICHSSWAFDAGGGRYDVAVGAALLDGYGLSVTERETLPILAMGACIRFALSRAWDWLNTPADALVTRKDPLAYLRRLDVYRDQGAGLFA